MTHLVQIRRGDRRAVALCDEPRLRILDGFVSVFDLAQKAIASRASLVDLVRTSTVVESLDYDGVYSGRSEWRLLTPIDHPHEPGCCLVSGTGLTHLGSAAQRQQMHEAIESELTDSMKMFRLGCRAASRRRGPLAPRPSGSTRGTAPSCARTTNRSTCPASPRMAAKRQRLPAST